jgi:putative PEP-CTERM system histidine kinase
MIFGYIGCTAVFLLILVPALTVWKGRLAGSSLVAALVVQCLWSIALALSGAGVAVPYTSLVAIDYLRSIAWALVLTRCLSGDSQSSASGRVLQAVAVLVGLFALTAVALPAVQLGAPQVFAVIDRYWDWGGLVVAIGGLILVEQVARNTRAAEEWNLRYVWLSIGGIFVFDTALHSVTLLRGRIPWELWSARGFVNALLGGLLAIGLLRVRRWGSSALLSPKLVFFSATLLAAGLYVLAIAGASYVVRHVGGSQGELLQAVFFAGALLMLAIAVLSEQVRARFRVTLAKHVLPYRYDYRSEWLKLSRALSEDDGSAVCERVGRVLAKAVGCGTFGVWLVDAERTFVPMGGDLAPSEGPSEPADTAFFEYLRQNEWIYDVEADRAGRGRPVPLPAPPGWILAPVSIRLIVPLVCEENLVGVAALGQPLAEMRVTWEEIDLLRAAGRQVASFLALGETARRLAEARQFEALNKVFAIAMHDLRHLVAQQALVVENAARHRHDPRFFDDAMLTIENSVKRMSRLIEELRAGAAIAGREQRVGVAEVCEEVVDRCRHKRPVPTLVLADSKVEIMANRDRMVHALEHIVRNAQDATGESGSVFVRQRRAGSKLIIEVADTGAGMDIEFIRHRLFRPFVSTKGEGGMGIGAYQAREFARACGGDLSVESVLGRGTTFCFTLPCDSLADSERAVTSYELQRS